jgi:sec-independent protein translocase protein TatA
MVQVPMFVGQWLGGWEVLALLVIALLVFGHKIPGMARNLGRGVGEFKQGLREGNDTQQDSKPARTEKPEAKA